MREREGGGGGGGGGEKEEIKDEDHSLTPSIARCLMNQSLLCDPNPNSPANSEAARLYLENKREYNRRVSEIVEISWTS